MIKKFSILLVVLSITLLVTSCGKDYGADDLDIQDTPTTEIPFEFREEPEESKEELPEVEEKAPLKTGQVGTINIPGLEVNDYLVQSDDNEYYHRRDSAGEYSFEGSYYLDYENKIDGSDFNYVVYGHNLSDNENDVKFAQLLKYRNPSFIKGNNIIEVTLGEKEYIYQVVSVFYTDTYFNYIQANPSDKDGYLTKYKDYNLYDTSAQLTKMDSFLTLSTCTYKFGSRADQRYVVVAKRVEEPEELVYTLRENPHTPTFMKEGEQVEL